MSENKNELKVVRYIRHQIRQTSNKKFSIPYTIQDTYDYFPYESIYVKTEDDAKKYIRNTLSDFIDIYSNLACSQCINFLITEFSLGVTISETIKDEESPNTEHKYDYVYSAIYNEKCE